MPNPVQTMEAANLFCGAEPTDISVSNHLVLSELKLPGLDEQYTEHRAGGAPVAIEIDTVISRLESGFSLAGWTPQVAGLVSSWQRSQNKFYAYGVIRDRQSGDALQAVAYMIGKLGKADPANWRRGDLMHWSYSIKGITHYELYTANEQVYYWDFFTNQFIVNGVDRNADVNNLLGIPATAAVPGVNPGIIAPATA